MRRIPRNKQAEGFIFFLFLYKINRYICFMLDRPLLNLFFLKTVRPVVRSEMLIVSIIGIPEVKAMSPWPLRCHCVPAIGCSICRALGLVQRRTFQMPFSYIACAVAVCFEHITDTHLFFTQLHIQTGLAICRNTSRQRKATCHKHRPKRRAQRKTADSIGEDQPLL
ncbi:hypothetical protein ES703_77978 [subsurface metagenome]